MADFEFANKSNSSDFSSTGDKVNEVFGDLLLNRTELETMITALKRRQYSATAPTNPNIGDIWECSTTGGGYNAGVAYRYNGSAWAELLMSAINVKNRNAVLQGKVDASGTPALFEAGTGLAVKLNATATPAVFAFMNGNSASFGAIDIVASVSADAATFWSSLPTSSTVYLYVDYTTGTVSGGFTTAAPMVSNVAPTHASGLHWLDFNTGKVWSSDGSAWTQRYRIFVGTATTDGSAVTAVSVYEYNGMAATVDSMRPYFAEKVGTTTDEAIVRYDGITGQMQNSAATVSDTGTINVPSGQKYKIGGVDLSAADVSAIASSILTTQGDLLIRGASALARLGIGTSGYYLKSQGAGANPTWAAVPGASAKIGSVSRAGATANGAVAYTGVGFTPKAIIFMQSALGDAIASSIGCDTQTSHFCLYQTGGEPKMKPSGSYSIYWSGEKSLSPATQSGYVSAVGSDGFTITWEKTSIPADITVYYLAIG